MRRDRGPNCDIKETPRGIADNGWRLRINRQEEGQGRSNFGLARPDWTDEHACIL